ncbi:putative monovalent cation/H+ antiporter subunit A [Cecembia lonarensis]|uniref:Multiple resistance and pH homeostasis protein A n=1 Tax=Cecembia lonarensis (strain CCUG 58316 / KCTC 22772 / LW9) TaxID=1225176 RepID=K1L6Y9_CECL9|nr:putative monovalent cation/H+ antiporter subunit A [Cecembia lonarensis]EKB47857.1 Multiple resistance and pH homeostasis protein A [Cecembia lonarensis LW9]
MLLAVLSGFIFALLVPLLSKFALRAIPSLLSAVPILLFLYFISQLSSIREGQFLLEKISWIPQLGINLSFRLDGLSMLFSLMITGIGALVFVYTSYYLKGHPYLDRFYGYLSMFMASMLGVVLSDNLITLFIFWELTSISSFFLIGFNNEEESSRKSAMVALGITGFGGLVMLAGFVWIGSAAGTYSLTELMTQPEVLTGNSGYVWILVLVFIGAFTKSAQFPFHFWLPGAMKAPTPVSTYLHSATMVKAGVFLLARFTPILGNTPEWNWTLTIVGAITMTYAAIHALFRTDLKSILAFSTISALGILVFLIGLGTEEALLGAGLFILTHALYKAALFLITGIIDHETGSRDVSRIAGLQHKMMPVAVAGYIAALSSAGVPFFLGFLSKEVMYEAVFHLPQAALILTILAVLTKICLLVAGFWAGIKPFTGKITAVSENAKLPSPRLWVPTIILGALSVSFGIFPALIEKSLILPVLSSMMVGPIDSYLALWHGFNWVLLLSVLTLLIGTAIYFSWRPSEVKFEKTLRFESFAPEQIIKGLGRSSQVFAKRWTAFFQNGYLRNYVITILIFLSVLVAYRLFSGVYLYLDWNQISEITPSEIIVVFLMVISIFFVILSKTRTAVIVSLGVIGFANCLFFLYYSAPDLAMTQFSIDTLTVLLFMLVLFKLPPNKTFSSKRIRLRDSFISLVFGALIAILTLEVFEEPTMKEVSEYYADNAYILAKGRNVVNVILVDYRGFDTMVETVVLVIAAIGVFSLMHLNLNPFKKD